MLYTPTAEGEKECRARVVKVHPDAEGPHYTILPHVKDAKEKNTTADRISKVRIEGERHPSARCGVRRIEAACPVAVLPCCDRGMSRPPPSLAVRTAIRGGGVGNHQSLASLRTGSLRSSLVADATR